ncbi:hypothetical protein Xcc3_24440 [Xanthomonas campestris pv. campestris]|nr:hypothetical protein Xcc3_24440 [Xanthomonas campestris pv. campestris]
MSAASPLRWQLIEHAPLRALNTFHVDATARWLLNIHAPEALPDALAAPQIAGQPLLVLGSGSNVLLAGDPPGCVLCFDNRDITTSPTMPTTPSCAQAPGSIGTGW